MKVTCPRDYTHRTKDNRWTATGRFNESRRGQRRAELRCLSPGCDYVWSSGLPDAIAAGELVAADPETSPGDLPVGMRVPQPSLPMQKTRGGDFVGTKQLAQSSRSERFMDGKRRQVGSE